MFLCEGKMIDKQKIIEDLDEKIKKMKNIDCVIFCCIGEQSSEDADTISYLYQGGVANSLGLAQILKKSIEKEFLEEKEFTDG